MAKTVVRPRRPSSRIICQNERRLSTSMADVGSSRKTTSGSPAIADREAHPLRLSSREVVGPATQERADVGSLHGEVERRRTAIEPLHQSKGLIDPHPRWQSRPRPRLEHRSDQSLGDGSARRRTGHLDLPRLRAEESEKDGDGGRLARAVRTEEGERLAPLHLEVEPIERDVLPVADGHVLVAEGRAVRSRRRGNPGHPEVQGGRATVRPARPPELRESSPTVQCLLTRRGSSHRPKHSFTPYDGQSRSTGRRGPIRAELTPKFTVGWRRDHSSPGCRCAGSHDVEQPVEGSAQVGLGELPPLPACLNLIARRG